MMAFDPATFEAEVALRWIPTEQLPSVAQDAMEAGFDGPHVVSMAILEPTDLWKIDQALPPMLEEIGRKVISVEEAALRLARSRAERILKSDEDLEPSLPYFYRLMESSGRMDELVELGYFGDEDIFQGTAEEEWVSGREALRSLLSPDFREERLARRQAEFERYQARQKAEWPYVLNSPTGRALFKQRCREVLTEARPALGLQVLAAVLVWWGYGGRAVLVLYAVILPLQIALVLLYQYRRMKWERRDLLLRARVPEDQI